MRCFVTVVALTLSVVGLAYGGGNPEPRLIDFEDYVTQYPFMSYQGVPKTFDTEFEWPEGYRRVDSTDLTDFQYWVSYMPLWGTARPVGAPNKGLVYRPEEITRAYNLPWRTVAFYDNIIPYQLLVEYQLANGSWYDFKVAPVSGDTMTFKRWLEGRVVYSASDSLYFIPADPREATEDEFNRFFSMVGRNTDYLSLSRNCDSVADSDVLPGDLLIGRSERGDEGRVYIVACVLVNDEGEKLYGVATGCPDGCDLHIPLFNGRRDYPWITMETLKELIPEELTRKGFFRLKTGK